MSQWASYLYISGIWSVYYSTAHMITYINYAVADIVIGVILAQAPFHFLQSITHLQLSYMHKVIYSYPLV
jgi:hypothetical protein